jgi:hypothetical protein
MKTEHLWFFGGVALIIVGVLAGLYIGSWWGFIGGIVLVIQEIRAEELSAFNIAFGVARIFFCTLIGLVSAALPIASGLFFIKMSD